jgi:phosphoglycerate dehydrogenase-like enzyme
VKVVTPIDDTPAARAGIMSGDIISAIDGESVQGMTLNQAVDKMRGQVNTSVKLTILRGSAREPRDIAITRAVIQKSLPRLKVISKYGIGLDKIDVKAATDLKVPVLFTPGVNHTTVAEHTFCLMLAAVRNLVVEANHTAAGRWTRITGNEVCGKTLAIVGFGRIGKEVAIRAKAFGLKVIGYGNYWDEDFARWHDITRVENFDDVLRQADIISLHTKLTPATKGLINATNFPLIKKGAVIVNTGRGELVDLTALVAALKSKHLLAYAADVLDQEPPPADHPLRAAQILPDPHVGEAGRRHQRGDGIERGDTAFDEAGTTPAGAGHGGCDRVSRGHERNQQDQRAE